MTTLGRPTRPPLISVAMPVYEPHPDYFRKAVESLLAQSITDWELIVVEDPSARSAADTLQAISDPRIRHIVNSRRTSQIEQRNRTLEESRGRYIALMDADDIAHPFRFAKQINFLVNHPDIDVVGSQIAVIDSEDRIVGHRWYPTSHNDIFRSAYRIVPVGQPTIMMRREVIDSFGGYRFTEFPCALEYEWWSRLLHSGVRFANLPEPLLYYRIHCDQIKQTKVRESISAVLRIKELYWSDSLKLSARLQRWAERALLYLPTRLVAWMLIRFRWHYRPNKNGPKVAAIRIPDSAAIGAAP